MSEFGSESAKVNKALADIVRALGNTDDQECAQCGAMVIASDDASVTLHFRGWCMDAVVRGLRDDVRALREALKEASEHVLSAAAVIEDLSGDDDDECADARLAVKAWRKLLKGKKA